MGSARSSLAPVVEKLAPLCRRIILFGSCAEGRNSERSDRDLFILTKDKEKVRRIMDGYPDIQAIVLNSIEYVQLQENDKPLYDRVNKGLELYGGEYGQQVSGVP